MQSTHFARLHADHLRLTAYGLCCYYPHAHPHLQKVIIMEQAMFLIFCVNLAHAYVLISANISWVSCICVAMQVYECIACAALPIVSRLQSMTSAQRLLAVLYILKLLRPWSSLSFALRYSDTLLGITLGYPVCE